MDSNSQRQQPTPISFRGRWRGLQVEDYSAREDADLDAGAELWPVTPGVKAVLFVDPVVEMQQAAREVLASVAKLTVCSTFADARARLDASPPDLLVTSVRLQAHNGLHLVYLAGRHSPSTRCLVSAQDDDVWFAQEVQAAGAFFVPARWLATALHSYVAASLPRRDRRNARVVDRRGQVRGGRRVTDV
jgi:DNA-binding NtrC family response regulator